MTHVDYPVKLNHFAKCHDLNRKVPITELKHTMIIVYDISCWHVRNEDHRFVCGDLYNGFSLVDTGLTGSHLGIQLLNVFSLCQGTLVGTKTSLGKFVNALIGSWSSGLNHIQNSAFIWRKSNNLTGKFSAQKGSLAGGLFIILRKQEYWYVSKSFNIVSNRQTTR